MKDKSSILVLVIFVSIGIIVSRFENANSVPLIIGLVFLYLGFLLYKKGQGKEPNLVRKIKPSKKALRSLSPTKLVTIYLLRALRIMRLF